MGRQNGTRTVPPDTPFEITLRLLAGASYVDIRLTFWIGRSSVSEIFHDTVLTVENALTLPGLPDFPEELNKIGTNFRLS